MQFNALCRCDWNCQIIFQFNNEFVNWWIDIDYLLFMSYQNEHPECVWLIESRALRIEYKIHSYAVMIFDKTNLFFVVVVVRIIFSHIKTHQILLTSVHQSLTVTMTFVLDAVILYTFCISLFWFNASVTDYCLTAMHHYMWVSTFPPHSNLTILIATFRCYRNTGTFSF